MSWIVTGRRRKVGFTVWYVSPGDTGYLTAPFLYTNSFSGLETMLFSSSVLVSLYLFARYLLAPGSLWRLVFLSAALLVTSLIRPEGVLLAAIVFGVLLVRSFGRSVAHRSLFFPGMLAYLLPALAYFLWRASYYGELLPNTFYVKASSGLISQASVFLELDFMRSYWLLPCLVLIAMFIARPRSLPMAFAGRLSPVLGCAATFAVGLLAFYAHAEQVQGMSYRFLVPLFGLGLLAVAVGADRLLPTFHPRSAVAWGLPALLAAAQLAVQLSALSGEVAFAGSYRDLLATEHIPAGNFLRSHLPATEWLAVYIDAGAIPYFSRLPSIDMGGLNDRTLADPGLPVQSRLDYVFSRHPGAFVITSRSLDHSDLDPQAVAITSDPRFTDSYRLVRALAPGGQQLGRPYYELIYVREDLLATTGLSAGTAP